MTQAAAAPLLSESWAGLLILLSVACYVRGLPVSGAILGIFAVLIRELAAPYCAVCALVSLRERRWREVTVWTLGAVVCAAYYTAHFVAVWAHRLPNDWAHQSSWVQGGGLQFVLNTVRINQWCLILPSFSAAGICTLILASWWTPVPLQLRAAALAYLAFFAVVGQPFNDYWGLVTAPLWAIAAAFGLHALRHLRTEAVSP
jgi:hypothetical protein